MALSRIVLKGTGSTNTFNVAFTLGWLNESDVTCQVAGEVDGSGNPIYRTITFVTPTQLVISGPAPGNGVDVIFTRSVPRNALLVNFNDADIMNEKNLQLMQKQMIMLVHEVLDGRFERLNSDINMGGFQFVALGTPRSTDLGAAATVQYVNTRISDGAVNATAAAASATAAASSASAAAGSASTAAAAASAAAAVETSVTAAVSTATTAAIAAGASATAAAGSASAAAGSATSAAGSASTANGHATTATTKAGEAASSATAAAGSASAAAGSATAASGSASAAAGSATTATTQATNASNSATRADEWANKAENSPVTTGPDRFSAYHWAKKAEAFGSGGGGGSAATTTFAPAPAAGISATNVQTAIEEVVSDVDTKLAGKLGTGATAADTALFGAQAPAYYQNVGNMNAGTLADARLPTRLGDAALEAKYARIGVTNTFTADQVISKANANLTINGVGTGSGMLFAVGGTGRMLMGIDSNGSFAINRYNSSGVLVANDLSIPHNGTPATIQGAAVITKGTKFFEQLYSTDIGSIVWAALTPGLVATGWYSRGTQTNGSNLRFTDDTAATGQAAVQNASSFNPSLPGTWVAINRFYIVQNNYCQCTLWVRNT